MPAFAVLLPLPFGLRGAPATIMPDEVTTSRTMTLPLDPSCSTCPQRALKISCIMVGQRGPEPLSNLGQPAVREGCPEDSRTTGFRGILRQRFDRNLGGTRPSQVDRARSTLGQINESEGTWGSGPAYCRPWNIPLTMEVKGTRNLAHERAGANRPPLVVQARKSLRRTVRKRGTGGAGHVAENGWRTCGSAKT